jgi:hypothetical protein
VECFRVSRCIIGDKAVGDLGLGQGGYNPFNFNYSPEEYFEKQVQETKHGRLAMLGAIGMILQYGRSGTSVAVQLSEAFNLPQAREVLAGPGILGDYFPQGL